MRKLAVLAGLLALLAAAALLLVRRSGTVEQNRPLQDVTPGEVSKIILNRGAAEISFEKTQGRWRLVAPVADDADPAAVEDLAAGLLALTLGSEVSREVESYPAYELNESSATRARLFAAGRAAAALDGYFGKPGLGYDSLYFRRLGEKPVYLTTGVAAYRLNRQADDFRERALCAIEPEQIAAITLRLSGAPVADAKPAIAKLAALRAAGFARGDEPPQETGFDKPALEVTLEGSVKKAGFIIGKPKAEKTGKPVHRYARVDGRAAILLVPAADVEAVIKIFSKR